MASGTIPIPEKYYYEDLTTTSRSSEYYGWYRGNADKYIGDRLSKLRAMFILRSQNNIPAIVFMADDMQYAYLSSGQPNKEIRARFVFER